MRRRQHRVVVEDRSVTPIRQRVVDLLHRSAGGVSLLSLRSWSIHRLFGRPGQDKASNLRLLTYLLTFKMETPDFVMYT